MDENIQGVRGNLKICKGERWEIKENKKKENGMG